MSKFSTPFFKKSPLEGAYENAADGRAFMGGLVSGQRQFAKLQQDIVKGFDNYMEGDGTQQRLQIKSQKDIDSMPTDTAEQQKAQKRAQQAHNTRFTTRGVRTQKEIDMELVELGLMTKEEFKEKYG